MNAACLACKDDAESSLGTPDVLTVKGPKQSRPVDQKGDLNSLKCAGGGSAILGTSGFTLKKFESFIQLHFLSVFSAPPAHPSSLSQVC